MSVIRREIDVPGFGSTVYRKGGAGSPVVLLHGFLGSSMYWDELIRALAGAHEVFAPDLPGFGESVDSVTVDTIEGFAKYVDMFVNELGIQRFDLVGHSMGGAIAQEYALRQSAKVDRLVLYGTSSSGALPERFESFEESIRRLQREGVDAHADRVVPTWFRRGQNDARYRVCRRAVARLRLDAAIAAQEAIGDWDASRRLRDIRSPTLVVAGDGDRSCSPREAYDIWSKIDGARLFIAPGCCHAVHLENAELFTGVLKGFLSDDRAP